MTEPEDTLLCGSCGAAYTLVWNRYPALVPKFCPFCGDEEAEGN